MINHNLDFGEIKNEYLKPEKPYKYVVIDDFLNRSIAEACYEDFPKENDDAWTTSRKKIDGEKNPFEYEMMAISNPIHAPSIFVDVINFLYNQFLDTISDITGISGLLKDDMWQWTGLRGMPEGSYQLIHSDAIGHPLKDEDKKLTMLVYMNKNWKPEYGGACEIWTDDMRTKYDEVFPKFNRALLFENTDKSYHGVPQTIQRYRKSFLVSYQKLSLEKRRSRAQFVKRPTENIKDFEKLSELRVNAKQEK